MSPLCFAGNKEWNKFIAVWRFHDAPDELRALSTHGGDEDWLALVPKGMDADEFSIPWLEDGGPFGRCAVSRYTLPGGETVVIGAHS